MNDPNTWSSEEVISYLKTTTDTPRYRRRIVFNNARAYFGETGQNHDNGDCVSYPANGYDGCALCRLAPREFVEVNPIGGNVSDMPDYLKVLGLEFLTSLATWHDNTSRRKREATRIRKYYL